MKKLLILALALSLPLAQAVRADTNNDKKKQKRHDQAQAAQTSHAVRRAPAQVPRRSVRQPVRATQHRVTPTHRSATTRSQTTRATNNRRPAVSSRNTQSHRSLQTHNRADRGQVLNRNVQRSRGNSNLTTQGNRSHRNFNRNSFSVARSHVIHQRHDRGWWRRNYGNTTFVLFGGGYYYLNDGYWYPAFGYSPIYNNYYYSEPIYSYNGLPPGQVLENVQIALRDLGYYPGPIDGLIGPQTRSALAAYQRDHGLVETAAVDEPTLVTLGLA